jgi:hypothetical protein
MVSGRFYRTRLPHGIIFFLAITPLLLVAQVHKEMVSEIQAPSHHTVVIDQERPDLHRKLAAVFELPSVKAARSELTRRGLSLDPAGFYSSQGKHDAFAMFLKQSDGNYLDRVSDPRTLSLTSMVVSDTGMALTVETVVDRDSLAITRITFTDPVTGDGRELNYQDGKLYKLSNSSLRTSSAQTGTVGCVMNALGQLALPCEASFLTNSLGACLGSLGVFAASDGVSVIWTAPACVTAAGALIQAVACANVDCGLSNPAQGSFSLSASPTLQSILAGQTATFTITATFSGGFPGPVNAFSVSNLPSGATSSFSASSIGTSGGTTTLTITTATNTAPIDLPVTISASGAGNLTATKVVELNINPPTSGSNFTDTIVSKTNPGGVCSDPPSSQSFATTDGTVYLYFYAVTSLSDHITSDWLAPDSTIVAGGNWGNPVSGNYCYLGASLNISGLPSSQIGGWKARVYDNGALQFSVPFTVSGTGSGGGPPAPVPQITKITPTTVPVGSDNTFTITGSGFQQGFSGKLWVGSNSFPLNPGAQTIWVGNPNQVQLIVRVGAVGDPTTVFGLQIINPDQQASAIYTGLTAQGGSAGGGTAGLQVLFSPNPNPLTSVSDCTGGKGYLFTFALSETQGVGLTPQSLNIDGSTGWTPTGLSQHIGPRGSGSFSLQWCRGSGSSV